MIKPFLLERESREVQIGERRFEMQEMSGADLRRYIELQLQPAETAVQQLVETGEAGLTAAVESMTASFQELFLWLLSRPSDGGPPADPALVESLSFRMRRKLIELQDELNDLETVLGNATGLLTRAQARRRAQEIQESAGPS